MLYVAVADVQEFIAGVVAASIAATAFEFVRRQRPTRFAPKARWLVGARILPIRMVVDSGVLAAVLWARLVHGRHVRGSFRRLPLPAGGAGGQSIARRALFIAGGSFAPNVFVISFEPDASSALVHRLVGRRGWEELVPGG